MFRRIQAPPPSNTRKIKITLKITLKIIKIIKRTIINSNMDKSKS
jgi:hypothetical protein